MHPGRDGQVGTSDWAEPALSHRPGTPQEQGASGEKGFPSFQHLRMLTEVLVELGRQGGEGEALRVPEGQEIHPTPVPV